MRGQFEFLGRETRNIDAIVDFKFAEPAYERVIDKRRGLAGLIGEVTVFIFEGHSTVVSP